MGKGTAGRGREGWVWRNLVKLAGMAGGGNNCEWCVCVAMHVSPDAAEARVHACCVRITSPRGRLNYHHHQDAGTGTTAHSLTLLPVCGSWGRVG